MSYSGNQPYPSDSYASSSFYGGQSSPPPPMYGTPPQQQQQQQSFNPLFPHAHQHQGPALPPRPSSFSGHNPQTRLGPSNTFYNYSTAPPPPTIAEYQPRHQSVPNNSNNNYGGPNSNYTYATSPSFYNNSPSLPPGGWNSNSTYTPSFPQPYMGNGGSGGQTMAMPTGPPPVPARVFSVGPPLPYPTNNTAMPYPNQMPTYNSNQWTKSQNGPRPPPAGSQTVTMGNMQHSFNYSTCQGKRKALLIGINYYNTKKELNGCINDVANLKEFLMRAYQYKPEDMVILTDDQSNPRSVPTKANILRAMRWLVDNAQPNDSLFFHFSGHGGQTKDLDGDEADGYDETIYPVDYLQKGQIVDDEMHDIMVKPLKPGVRLTAIFDSCHSGTALDLPYVYSTAGTIKEQNLLKDAGLGLISAVGSFRKNDISGVMQSGIEFFNRATNGRAAEERARRTKYSSADVIQWSGSKDSQTSADDRGNGAMSRAFVVAMSKNPNQSYKQMLNSLRNELSMGRFTQKPQLSCSHPLDTDLLFIM